MESSLKATYATLTHLFYKRRPLFWACVQDPGQPTPDSLIWLQKHRSSPIRKKNNTLVCRLQRGCKSNVTCRVSCLGSFIWGWGGGCGVQELLLGANTLRMGPWACLVDPGVAGMFSGVLHKQKKKVVWTSLWLCWVRTPRGRIGRKDPCMQFWKR